MVSLLSSDHLLFFNMQEICSFLKGSSEALESANGKLSLEEYLEVLNPFACLTRVNHNAQMHGRVAPICSQQVTSCIRAYAMQASGAQQA